MAFAKMKPPAGVQVITIDGVFYSVDGQGFAYSPEEDVEKFEAAGWVQVIDQPPGVPGALLVEWGDIEGKPTTFPPVVGSGADEAKPGNYVPAWGEVTGKPTTFAPATHTHDIGNVTGLQAALDLKATVAALNALDARVAALESPP